ncbi:MAG: cation:proton antiporter [Treponema sp.]|nr:cation:proton antiporter [Treponema sp.]
MHNPLATLLPGVFHFQGIQATQFVLLLGIILFLGAFGGWLFQKLKIPQVVGYIVIGILIGSSGFHVLEPQVIAALDPISTVALAFIGFLVGGELKMGNIKKYGKQFISILIFEAITPAIIVGLIVGLVVYAFTKDSTHAISMALILGAICSATAPAATTDVLVEYRTKGPLTTTVYGIVAMDDAFALILYTIASTIVTPLIGGNARPFGIQVLFILRDIFGSIAIGCGFGFILNLILKHLTNEDGRILSFSLGTLFICTGICQIFDFDNILAAMALGFFMVNFAPVKTRAVFSLVQKFTPPIYVLFFVLVGAKLNIWIITPFLGLIAIIYVLGRTFGKTIGSMFGAWITKAPKTVQNNIPFCLLSQAGVAIGLSIAAGTDFADSIGPQILLIITATTFIVQLIGPIFVKIGVTKAGEVGLNVTVDDIKKNARVTDVTWGNEHICNSESPAIVCETDMLFKILNSFSKNQNLNYVVKNSENGKLAGIISLEHLKEVMQIGDFAESMLAMDVMDKPVITCKPSTTLPDAYKLFEEYDIDSIPIVEEGDIPLGILEKNTVDHYLHTRIIELNRKLDSLDA